MLSTTEHSNRLTYDIPRDFGDYENRESLIIVWAPSFAAATAQELRNRFLRRCYRLWLKRFPEDLLGGRPTYEQETRQIKHVDLPLMEDFPDFIGGWLEAVNEEADETVELLSKGHSRRYLRDMKWKLIDCIEDALKKALKAAHNCLIKVNSDTVLDELHEATYRWDLYNRLPKNLLQSAFVHLLDHPYEPFADTPPQSIFKFEWLYPLPSYDFDVLDQCISEAEECISDAESIISSARSGDLDLPYPFYDKEYDVSVSGKPSSDEEEEEQTKDDDADADDEDEVRSMISIYDDFINDAEEGELFDADGEVDPKGSILSCYDECVGIAVDFDAVSPASSEGPLSSSVEDEVLMSSPAPIAPSSATDEDSFSDISFLTASDEEI